MVAFLLAAGLSPGALASAASSGASSQEYLIDVWQTEQGLPQNHVTAIVQSKEGYLWIGTYEGLARFDGVRFVVFHAARHPGLQSARVTSLHEDAEGSLWIGHEHGELTRMTCAGFEVVKSLDQRAKTRGGIVALSTTRGPDGAIDPWMLHGDGTLIRLRDDLVIRSPSDVTVPSLARAPEGALWRSHGGQLTRVMGDTASRSAFPMTNEFVLNACANRSGGLWIITGERLRRWKPGESQMEYPAGPWGDVVTAMVEGTDGRLWVGTLDRGLFVRSPDGSLAHFDRATGLPSDWIRCLLEDSEGTLWVGTGGGGLCAVRKRRVSMVQAPDQWQGRAVLSISATTDGGLWVGTEGAGLYRIVEDQITRFGVEEGLGNQFVWSVLEDRDRGVWAGTWGKGLFRKTGNRWMPVAGLDGDGTVVAALHRGRSNDLWVGTQQGLARLQGDGTIEWIGRDLVSPDVRCVVEMEDGSVWFGMSGGGVARWRDGQVTQYRKPQGLPSNDVWSLLPGSNGALWIGTLGGGLSRWRDGRFVNIGEREGLPSSVICQMVDDGRGLLWLSTRAGILRVPRKELEDLAEGRVKSANFMAHGKSDGLTTLECSGGFQPAYCLSSDGRLWFPTARGVAGLSPEQIQPSDRPPPIVIEEMLVGGTPVGSGARREMGALKIPAGQQRFEFRFTALSFIAPERVRFKYRLEGMEEDWAEVDTQRMASYRFLPPGHYVFRVTGCNSDGVWNTAGATLAFSVMPFVWQTWWFQALAAVGATGVVGGGVRVATRRRYRRKLERVERQRAVERERTRIAQDIHDDLGASLTRITLLSQTAREDLSDPDMAAKHLERIYSTARELTRAMDEIVWAVNPKHDTLDSLVTYLGRFAQDLASAAGLRCRIDVPTELPAWPLTAEARHNLFLAFKEAMNNVVRHARAAELRVVFHLKESGFVLSLEDDGTGFDPGLLSESRKAAKPEDELRVAGGNGLANMRRRMIEIGAECVVASVPGQGTQVRFSVPVHRRFP